MKYLFLLTLLITSTASLADEASVAANKEKTAQMREMLIGKWCGSKHLADGDYQRWMVNRKSDGTYAIKFTLTKKDKTSETWGEYGIWGIRYPIYFTAVRGFIDEGSSFPADTNTPTLYDAFRVKNLTSDSFTYKSFTSGNTFTVSKKCNHE